ncbi:MAG TPA: dUTP diphosphatase [Acidimicrobiia bacterium]|jgi:dUTP pyrophosphatase|nr:dUTP diphosphatase [Acidimicrobiia bacterium]
MHVTFRRLNEAASIPKTAHPGDAGYDIAASEAVDLQPGERALVPTGLAMAIPEGYAGLVVPRSGLAIRHGISVVNGPGLYDSGYRGEMKVILINHGTEPVRIAIGDRIAQLVIVSVPEISWEETAELPESARGDSGFGSTGGFDDGVDG